MQSANVLMQGLWFWAEPSSEIAPSVGEPTFGYLKAPEGEQISTEMHFHFALRAEMDLQKELFRRLGSSIKNVVPRSDVPNPTDRLDYAMMQAGNRRIARQLGVEVVEWGSPYRFKLESP